MCGIVGIVSKKYNILPSLIDGLKNLEYRGYDSAGVAYFINNNLKIIKEKGTVKNLENKIDFKEKVNIGIAHTRWATHGNANKINAHPHNVNHITIVHNGIIENCNELKKDLKDYNYTFKSNTDTEIACAYLSYCYDQNKNIHMTIERFMDKVKGSYAIALLIDNDDKNIYLLKKESPLIIGLGKDTNYIASDITAILNYTNKYISLDDFQYAKVNYKDILVYNKSGDVLKKKINEYKSKNIVTGKAHYKHYMLKEIFEQKKVISNTIFPYLEKGIKSLLKLPNLTKYNQINIIGCGSAMHAGLVAKYLFREFTNTKCEVFLASEFRYQNNFLTTDTFNIFISQSGETADTLQAAKLIKEKKLDSLGIINAKESSITKVVDTSLYIEVGPEISVASTKAYSAQVAILALLVLSHGYRNKTISSKQTESIINEFKKINVFINKMSNKKDQYKMIAKKIYKEEHAFYIGRGLDYALCMEGSLKLKEVSYIHSEAYAAGELKHGAISLINKNMPVFSSATNDKLNSKTVSNLEEVISRGANVFLITDDKNLIDKSYETIIIPNVSIFLKGILVVIPYQLIAYYTAVLKGTNIDKPKNLAKSVTVE